MDWEQELWRTTKWGLLVGGLGAVAYIVVTMVLEWGIYIQLGP